jgi:ZIP family zinc transporter
MVNVNTINGILIPFLGTSLGAACVFFMKGNISCKVQQILTGFAAGVMTAASVWSLLIPALEQSENRGRMSWIPAVIGFWLGILLFILIDIIAPEENIPCQEKTGLLKNGKLFLAVTLHNIPEGMAVGVVYAGFIAGNAGITGAGALALALGIAIQNFPEGAIISMPLKASGVGKGKSFVYGVLSGAVEPIGAVITIIAAGLVTPILPYFLSFAAGAMIYVVIKELMPELTGDEGSYAGIIVFTLGFTLMMSLDVALG